MIKRISVFPRTAPLEMKPYKIRNAAVESGGHVHSVRTALTRGLGFGGEQSGPLKTFTPGQRGSAGQGFSDLLFLSHLFRFCQHHGDFQVMFIVLTLESKVVCV